VDLQRCTFVGCADLAFRKSDASATACPSVAGTPDGKWSMLSYALKLVF